VPNWDQEDVVIRRHWTQDSCSQICWMAQLFEGRHPISESVQALFCFQHSGNTVNNRRDSEPVTPVTSRRGVELQQSSGHRGRVFPINSGEYEMSPNFFRPATASRFGNRQSGTAFFKLTGVALLASRPASFPISPAASIFVLS